MDSWFLKDAVAVIRRHWRGQDLYGEYNRLLFHEEPENWADHLFYLQQDPDFWVGDDPLPSHDRPAGPSLI